MKPFFEIDALLAERHEEVGARVGIDDRLERDLRFRHRERRRGIDGVPPGRAEEVADDRRRGVEDVRRGLRRGAARLRYDCGDRGVRRSGGGSLSCLNARSLDLERRQPAS